MEKGKNVIIQKALLKWLMMAILVLVLISFAGPDSALSFARVEIAKIELREPSRGGSNRTVSLKNLSDGLSRSFSQIPDQTRDFISYLLEYQSNVNVKIKRSIKALASIKLQVKRFLEFYSYVTSGDSGRKE